MWPSKKLPAEFTHLPSSSHLLWTPPRLEQVKSVAPASLRSKGVQYYLSRAIKQVLGNYNVTGDYSVLGNHSGNYSVLGNYSGIYSTAAAQGAAPQQAARSEAKEVLVGEETSVAARAVASLASGSSRAVLSKETECLAAFRSGGVQLATSIVGTAATNAVKSAITGEPRPNAIRS